MGVRVWTESVDMEKGEKKNLEGGAREPTGHGQEGGGRAKGGGVGGGSDNKGHHFSFFSSSRGDCGTRRGLPRSRAAGCPL